MRVGGQLHAPAALTPGKRPGTHCIGGYIYTGHTQKNGAVSIVFTIETAPLFCVYPVYINIYSLREIFVGVEASGHNIY
jgi:hypothetical protein